MAKFDLIYLTNGQTESCVNVSATVGNGGRNLREDILLIQALINYIADGLGRDVLGLEPEYDMPEINGEMDSATYSAIGQFQVRNLQYLMMKTFDGRIHPASYKNRKITLIGKPKMTITLLHTYASDASMMSGKGLNYTQQIASMNQELAIALDRSLMEM